jgi:hypothetical protein
LAVEDELVFTFGYHLSRYKITKCANKYDIYIYLPAYHKSSSWVKFCCNSYLLKSYLSPYSFNFYWFIQTIMLFFMINNTLVKMFYNFLFTLSRVVSAELFMINNTLVKMFYNICFTLSRVVSAEEKSSLLRPALFSTSNFFCTRGLYHIKQ